MIEAPIAHQAFKALWHALYICHAIVCIPLNGLHPYFFLYFLVEFCTMSQSLLEENIPIVDRMQIVGDNSMINNKINRFPEANLRREKNSNTPVDVPIMGPTWERYRHGPIEKPSRQVVDSAGGIGAPYRSLDWLDLMARRGAISQEMRAAGDRFAADFHRAQYDTLRAVRLDRLRTGPNERAPSDPAESSLDARRRVGAAQHALGGLGSPCERAIWHVLGFGRTIAEWCRAEGGWLRQETAKGILVGALGVLALHYGMERRDGSPGAAERGRLGRHVASAGR